MLLVDAVGSRELLATVTVVWSVQLIQEGVEMCQALQTKMGAPISTTLSQVNSTYSSRTHSYTMLDVTHPRAAPSLLACVQRDVPGMTRSVIPVLKKAGVTVRLRAASA